MKLLGFIQAGLKYQKNPFYVTYLQGRKVLDIGCGNGAFLARDPKNFIGADIDHALVWQCQQQGLNAICMSALQLEFADESFDAVHAAQLIEHFTPAEAALFLKEAARVLRPNGIVFLTTPGVRIVWNTFTHIRPYPPASFIKILSNPTEKYIHNEQVGLSFEGAWGSRWYTENRILLFLVGIIDLLFPPKDPLGWTIILRKNRAV